MPESLLSIMSATGTIVTPVAILLGAILTPWLARRWSHGKDFDKYISDRD